MHIRDHLGVTAVKDDTQVQTGMNRVELGSPDYQEKVLFTMLLRSNSLQSGPSFIWLSAITER